MGNPPLKGMAHPHGAVGSGPLDEDLSKGGDD
jgi:hypothetical protein